MTFLASPLVRDIAARVAISVLFLWFASRIAEHFLATGRITGLLLLASELLVVALTITRRRAAWVEPRLRPRAFALLSLIGPLLLRPTPGAGGFLEPYAAVVSAAGLLIAIGGKLSLGRSFGLLPANRGVVCSGLYRVVRHPIYLGYLITHIAFLLAHPSLWNAVVLVAADSALLVRAVYEEATLEHDPAYAAYLGQVRWRVVPGVF